MASKKANAKPVKKRRNTRTRQQRMDAFLTAFGETCNVLHAAQRAGIDRKTHYRWLESGPNYARAFTEAKRLAGEFLEAEAVKRSTAGWLEPVFYQGARCGHVRRFDGGLLQFLLRGAMPEKYGHKTEISGPNGTPIEANIKVTFVRPGDTDARGD